MITKCEKIGMAGNCDYDCPIFAHGDCDTQDEMFENLIEEFFILKSNNKKLTKEIKDNYNHYKRFDILDMD